MSANIAKLTPTTLAALLCARICHDLISPVGALGTALEVLDDDANSDMHEDALDLVRNSSRQAGAKLRFLRLALGAGGSAPGIIAMNELNALVSDMYCDGKATIGWTTAMDGVDKTTARILLNLTMLAVQSIPRGGEIDISVSSEVSETHVVMMATGPKARLDPTIEIALAGKAPEAGFDGRTIQPFYTGLIAREVKGTITASVDAETVKFSAIVPSAASA